MLPSRKLPEPSYVAVRSVKPYRLYVTVTVPSPLIVSAPLKNPLRRANKGGTFKAGGWGGDGGGAGFAFTVSVKLCVTARPTPLLAVIVRRYAPCVPAAGTPARAAVPLPLSVKVTPLGNPPDTVKVGVGEPLAVTRKLPP